MEKPIEPLARNENLDAFKTFEPYGAVIHKANPEYGTQNELLSKSPQPLLRLDETKQKL